jgi:uncharacterized protein with PQ loop repeat
MWQYHPRDHATSQSRDGGLLDRILPVLSLFTMAMTVPQVWSVWVEQDTAGVSVLSWLAYLLAACMWFVDGLRKHDRTIWVACIGWIVMDAAVVVGVLVRH